MAPERAQPLIDRRLRGAVDHLVAVLAARQHGVLARRQLLEAGVTADEVATRLRARRLRIVHRGVYTTSHGELSREARWMAAVLRCGDGAVLSHGSAAAAWGIRPTASRRADVTVSTRGGKRPLRDIVVHRSGRLAPAEVTELDGIPITSPARTLLDLADVVAPRALRRAAEEAETLRLFDLTALEAVLDANPGRVGAGVLAAVLEDLRRGSTWTRSELEERFIVLCARHGLPRPEVNARIAGLEVDFLWRDAGLVVETDGFRHHGGRTAFERDRARDARLAALGLHTLRFTYRQVVDDATVVVETVRTVLRARGGARSGADGP